jgi:hypothetical protein
LWAITLSGEMKVGSCRISVVTESSFVKRDPSPPEPRAKVEIFSLSESSL